MAAEDTLKLLDTYHEVSKHIETEASEFPPMQKKDKAKAQYHELTSTARELVSRCILSDDPRTLIFLIEQIGILLKIFGHLSSAGQLIVIARKLARHYLENTEESP